MNFQKFFELAKQNGIAESQIQVSRGKHTSIKLFHKEIDNFTIAETQSVTACGIYNGKFGSASTQKLDKDSFQYLVDQIKDSATYSEKDNGVGIFKGSEKYHKKNVYNAELPLIPMEKKIALMHEVEDGLLASDKRISEVEEVDYDESESETLFLNSYGLKLKQKGNHYYYVASCDAKQGEDTKVAFKFFLDNDFSKFDPKDFVKKLFKEVIDKLGGLPCKSGQYPTVLYSGVLGDLISYFLSSASSEEVQKQSSFLIGKLGQKVASSKLTIEERPLEKNIFFSYFDDEGVATQNKFIVKNGVLKTYLYNRETAKKDGVESTGNGTWAGPKIGVGLGYCRVKPGKQSFDEMILPIKEGVYINDIQGLGTGMNSTSGDFSCQASGFMIRDGKLAEPLNLITLSGNLLKMLADLKGFDNAVDLKLNAVSLADAYIKSMSVGGK